MDKPLWSGDPVAAYDRLAGYYRVLGQKRERYLLGVEREIVKRIPARSRSLLDVGAGDGSRALRIASKAGIRDVVLVEPSQKMRALNATATQTWSIRAEDLDPSATSRKFDLITCLWNVLGHVEGNGQRVRALLGMQKLLPDDGLLFLDVTHRYNVRSYGTFVTAARWLHDVLVPRETNGDVQTNWQAGEARITAYGHVFTHREIVELANRSALQVNERIVIDYADGSIRAHPCQGNLLYVLSRSSRIDSSSAPHTS